MKRYQIVYAFDKSNSIVFVGTTDKSIDDLLTDCEELLDLSVSPSIVAVSYEPIKDDNDESKTS